MGQKAKYLLQENDVRTTPTADTQRLRVGDINSPLSGMLDFEGQQDVARQTAPLRIA